VVSLNTLYSTEPRKFSPELLPLNTLIPNVAMFHLPNMRLVI
jgi:hypothetical protein